MKDKLTFEQECSLIANGEDLPNKKQIEEMAKDIENTILGLGIHLCNKSAEKFYNLGYRKLPENSILLSKTDFDLILPDNSVVLSKEEYEKLTAPRLFISKTHLNNKDLIDELNRVGNYGILGEVSGSVELLPTRAEIEKETAEKILKELYMHFSADKLCGIVNPNKNYNSAKVVSRLAKQLDVEIKEN